MSKSHSPGDVRAERLGWDKPRDNQPKSLEPIYDDFDYTYKDLSKRVENSRTRVRKSKQFGADGKRLAPWMVIDEDKVEKIKADRLNRIKKEKASAGGGKAPKKKNFWEL